MRDKYKLNRWNPLSWVAIIIMLVGSIFECIFTYHSYKDVLKDIWSYIKGDVITGPSKIVTKLKIVIKIKEVSNE